MPTNVRNSRSAVAADFTFTNPYLGDGEERYETDTGKSKIGPGYWNSLPYGAGQDSAGSGASVPSTDYATWARGAPFEMNFSFDWVADQTHVDPGGWIVLDTSPAWADPDTGASGHPTAMTTADGLYQFVARMEGPYLVQAGDYAQAELHLLLEDITGATIPDGTTNLLLAHQSEVFPAPLPLSVVLALTLRLPAGTHFEFAVNTQAVINAVPDNNDSLFMLRTAIKRVA